MNELSYIPQLNDTAILQEIGIFIKNKRLTQELTQDELSDRANISRSTLSLMESGQNTSLVNLVKVLRILDALYVFESFKIEQIISPIELAKQEAKERKRASVKQKNKNNNKPEW